MTTAIEVRTAEVTDGRGGRGKDGGGGRGDGGGGDRGGDKDGGGALVATREPRPVSHGEAAPGCVG